MSDDFLFVASLIAIEYLKRKKIPPGDGYTEIIENPTTPVHLSSKRDVLIRNGNITAVKGGDSYCILTEGCTNIGVQGGIYRTATKALNFRYTNTVRVSNVDISDCSETALRFPYCSDVIAENPRISDTVDNGLDVGFTTNVVVINPYIRRVSAYGNGIDTDSTNKNKIYTPDVADCISNGIMVQRSNMVEIAGGTVQRCKTGVSIINNIAPVYVHDLNISGCTTAMWIGAGQTVYLDNVVTDKPISKATSAVVYIDKGAPPNWF